MRTLSHPNDDLRLVNERAAQLHRHAAEQRLASQLRADRGAHPTFAGAGPNLRRRGLAVLGAIVMTVSVGVLADRAQASSVADDVQVVSPCDHADGYRPVCSMQPARPDGWFQN